MEVRVVTNCFDPSMGEILPLAAITLKGILAGTPTRRLHMNDSCLRRAEVGQTAFPHAKAEIDVVQVGRQIFAVKTADRLEFASADSDTRRGNRVKLARRFKLVQVSLLIGATFPVDMAGKTAHPQHDTGMLNCPIRKQ